MIEDQVSYGDAFAVALSLTPDLDLVARASDAEAGTQICQSTQPDLVLCDYRLPDGHTGTRVAETLRESGFVQPIIILTGFAAPQVLREAAAIKDVHVLSKDSGIKEIVTDVRSVLAGLDPATTATAAAGILSAGELEVLEHLNQGESPAAVATLLHLSLHTIRARIKAIHRKLAVTSQNEAIAVATRLGLLVPPT